MGLFLGSRDPFPGVHLFQSGRLSGVCLLGLFLFPDVSQRAATVPPPRPPPKSVPVVDGEFSGSDIASP